MQNPNFSPSENTLSSQLQDLFDQWTDVVCANSSIKSDDLCFDGFYPFYLSQKVKVLFLCREARGLANESYIDVLYGAYKNKIIGSRPIDSIRTHYMQFYLTYALNNGCAWSDIPYASSLCEKFGEAGGISFAAMNFSKYSNETDDFTTDQNRFNAFVEASVNDKINFWSRQIEICNPNVIIAMNLNALGSNYEKIGKIELLKEKYPCKAYKIHLSNGTQKLLIDTPHFSSTPRIKGISEKDWFFEPIIELCREINQCK